MKPKTTLTTISAALDSGVPHTIETARRTLLGYEESGIFSKPAGKPVIRITFFSRMRTIYAINYSDGMEPEVVKFTRSTLWREYLDRVGA